MYPVQIAKSYRWPGGGAVLTCRHGLLVWADDAGGLSCEALSSTAGEEERRLFHLFTYLFILMGQNMPVRVKPGGDQKQLAAGVGCGGSEGRWGHLTHQLGLQARKRGGERVGGGGGRCIINV